MSKGYIPEKTGVISWLYHVGAEGASAVDLQPKIIQLEEWTALLSLMLIFYNIPRTDFYSISIYIFFSCIKENVLPMTRQNLTIPPT
jgi:hypothetical protein